MKDLYSFFSFLKMYNYLTIIIDMQSFYLESDSKKISLQCKKKELKNRKNFTYML